MSNRDSMRFINPIPFVRDIKRSREFYEKRLGLKVVEDAGSFVLFETGFAIHDGAALEQTVWGEASETSEPYGRRNLLLYFEHDDVDAAFESIAPHVELIHPVVQQAWGQRVFRFYDPDGHTVEVGEPQGLGPVTSSEYINGLRLKVGRQLVLLPSVAAVIRDDRGCILLQEKASGEGWSLPAGGIEPGETPQQAIQREVLEETGLTVQVAGVLGVFGGRDFRYTYPNGDEVEYVVTLFRCVPEGPTGSPTDRETGRLKFTAHDEMPRLALPYPMDMLFGELMQGGQE